MREHQLHVQRDNARMLQGWHRLVEGGTGCRQHAAAWLVATMESNCVRRIAAIDEGSSFDTETIAAAIADIATLLAALGGPQLR